MVANCIVKEENRQQLAKQKQQLFRTNEKHFRITDLGVSITLLTFPVR